VYRCAAALKRTSFGGLGFGPRFQARCLSPARRAVLTELSKLHEKLNRTRARMGLPAPEPLALDAPSGSSAPEVAAPQVSKAQLLASLVDQRCNAKGIRQGTGLCAQPMHGT